MATNPQAQATITPEKSLKILRRIPKYTETAFTSQNSEQVYSQPLRIAPRLTIHCSPELRAGENQIL